VEHSLTPNSWWSLLLRNLPGHKVWCDWRMFEWDICTHFPNLIITWIRAHGEARVKSSSPSWLWVVEASSLPIELSSSDRLFYTSATERCGRYGLGRCEHKWAMLFRTVCSSNLLSWLRAKELHSSRPSRWLPRMISVIPWLISCWWTTLIIQFQRLLLIAYNQLWADSTPFCWTREQQLLQCF
jgi:hypothetical protein